MNNIFNNSFYETPPQPTWAFKVHFDSEDLTELEKQTLSSAVSKIIIPERKNDPSLDVGFAGFIKSFRNRTSNSGSVTFEFNENQNMTVRSVLKKLQKNAISNDYYDTTSTYEKTSLDRFDIHLQMINPENPDEVLFYYDMSIGPMLPIPSQKGNAKNTVVFSDYEVAHFRLLKDT